MGTWGVAARAWVVGVGVVGAGCATPGRVAGPGVYGRLNERLTGQYLDVGKGGVDPVGKYLALRDAGKAESAEEWRRLRDDIVYGLMAIDDHNFQTYAASAALAGRWGNMAGDVAVMGLTTTAALTGGAEAKGVLAGVAAVVTGSRVALEKDVLFDTALPVLVDRMRTLREVKRVEIEGRLREADDDRYPLVAALSEVYAYYQAGTLPAALADIARENGGEGKE